MTIIPFGSSSDMYRLDTLLDDIKEANNNLAKEYGNKYKLVLKWDKKYSCFYIYISRKAFLGRKLITTVEVAPTTCSYTRHSPEHFYNTSYPISVIKELEERSRYSKMKAEVAL